MKKYLLYLLALSSLCSCVRTGDSASSQIIYEDHMYTIVNQMPRRPGIDQQAFYVMYNCEKTECINSIGEDSFNIIRIKVNKSAKFSPMIKVYKYLTKTESGEVAEEKNMIFNGPLDKMSQIIITDDNKVVVNKSGAFRSTFITID